MKESSKFQSRKFWLTVGVILATFGSGIVAAIWPAFRLSLDTVVGAQLTAMGMYLGVNLGNKWVMGKKAPEPRDPKTRTRATDRKGKKEEGESEVEPQGE